MKLAGEVICENFTNRKKKKQPYIMEKMTVCFHICHLQDFMNNNWNIEGRYFI